MSNDRKNALSFEAWVNKPSAGGPVDAKAAEKAKAYLENQDVIGDAWKDVSDQGKILFQEAKGFVGGLGDHIPGILAAIGVPLVMSFMGGGGFSLMGVLLGAAAALGIDALISGDNSYVSQIIGMFTNDKDKPAEVVEKEHTRQKDLRIKAGVDAAPTIEPYQKPQPLGRVKLEAVDRNDPIWPAGATQAMDVVLNKESTVTTRVYGNIDSKGMFHAVGQRGIFAGEPGTRSALSKLDIDIPVRKDEATGQAFAVMEAETSAKLRIASALATNTNPETLATKRAETDFISGRFNITKVEQAKGSKNVTITVASQSSEEVARTFGGTMDNLGNLYINNIMEQNPDGTSVPKALPLKKVFVLENVGVSAVAATKDSPLQPSQPTVLDPNKLNPGKLAPLVKKFGPEVNDMDITPEIATPAGLPTITKLDVGGKKKARPGAQAGVM